MKSLRKYYRVFWDESFYDCKSLKQALEMMGFLVSHHDFKYVGMKVVFE